MHLLVREGASLDEVGEPRDLGLNPADFILLSFSDSDLNTFRKGWNDLIQEKGSSEGSSAHFINLALLRHPISIDIFIDKTLAGAKAVVLRLLGGLDFWRYGAEELANTCRRLGISLAVLPGDGRPDPRLPMLSTVAPDELDFLDRLFSAGGIENARLAIDAFLTRTEGTPICARPNEHFPDFGVYRETAVEAVTLKRAAVIFYRSFMLADDVRPIDALCDALECAIGEDGKIAVTAYFVSSLKNQAVAKWLKLQFAKAPPDVIVNTTAFSVRGEHGASVLDFADCPVLQVAMAGNSQAAWRASPRGLSSTDLAMHVVLPELDGRLFAGLISFKEPADSQDGNSLRHTPFHPGIAHVSALASAWAKLRRKSRTDRKLALVLSTYPGRPDQVAHAVGLDGPASAYKIAQSLLKAGYAIEDLPENGSDLLSRLINSQIRWPVRDYETAFARLPEAFRESVFACWGSIEDDPAISDGDLKLSISAYGRFYLGLQPERGFLADRKSGYHDANVPPRHSYIAFYLWLRDNPKIDALIHLGAHGTLEWLPGKAVALSAECAVQAISGPIPIIYPFIVNDPGEAAQAKRRIGAVTIGHNAPPLTETAPSPALVEIERLLDEYAAAEGLDKKRRERLANDVVHQVKSSGLSEACGLKAHMSQNEALARVDAFLCDVKQLAIRDGLHILDSGEIAAILQALDGRFIEPGPSGAPSRGRSDVLPTGRNLYSVDPRTIPTPLAYENGVKMASALVARYVEDNGDWPRSMVLDLWGSQTMRTGGEELATALALLGVTPTWDYQSFRLSGFEIVPLAKLVRPRVDVTLRISGLLRDMFPTQLTLFHEAVKRVASLGEAAEMNPLRRIDGAQGVLWRIFGAPDGAYGTGVSQKIDSGDWKRAADLGFSYLSATNAAYGGEGQSVPAGDAFEKQVQAADCFLHIQDHRETDLLSSLDFAAHEGGFAAAAEALHNERVDVYHADSADPASPYVRDLKEECARILHGRALSPRWLEGQMRHGFRGAAEIATTVDASFAFAATAGAVSSEGLEHLYNAYLGDPTVSNFLAKENSAALEAIQRRFKEAIARSLWEPRRNDLSALEGAVL